MCCLVQTALMAPSGHADIFDQGIERRKDSYLRDKSTAAMNMEVVSVGGHETSSFLASVLECK
jgi:hypothetical protein